MKKITLVLGALSLAAMLTSSFTAATNNAAGTTIAPAVAETTLLVNTQNSTLKWNAKKVGGEHYGTINLADGSLQVNGSKLTGGTFTIAMGSIVVKDITRPDSNKKLTDHLKSDDFFAVEKHPEATFTITKAAKLAKPKAGEPNYNITGNLTIKGITNPITFPATVTINGKAAEATALVEVDRTKYDIKYRSGMMGTAADKVIYDTFTIDLKLVAEAGTKTLGTK
ncbi:YceI family protein [Pontibacter fetidus]|uniref:YceI family protein n=1 Tax=Pontibacter fetidus TaxID=2700082 RepID=A0A6B2H9K5_9BACT|nr:YceI family protein [Pontibacter fetidus]NDK57427.1 YceI family protein [Pontibacter fetidus]